MLGVAGSDACCCILKLAASGLLSYFPFLILQSSHSCVEMTLRSLVLCCSSAAAHQRLLFTDDRHHQISFISVFFFWFSCDVVEEALDAGRADVDGSTVLGWTFEVCVCVSGCVCVFNEILPCLIFNAMNMFWFLRDVWLIHTSNILLSRGRGPHTGLQSSSQLLN